MTCLKVYIASPYSNGDMILNVRRQILCAGAIISAGHAPYSPLAGNYIMHMVEPRHYEEWLRLDFVWVSACDVVLRLQGASPGADREVELAGKLGIPVVHSHGELVELAETWPKYVNKGKKELHDALVEWYSQSDGITVGIPGELANALIAWLKGTT
jgi:hypothetical protein